jgi:DUF1680 family protein
VVAGLARCQQENGGEWAGPIPPDYLDWAARGKPVWAPHYTVHKTLMGLLDMAALAGSAQALEVMERWARWFSRWTARFSREEMDTLLDVETGGMMEVWADLYGLTGKAEHLELMQRYERRRLFEALLAGDDPLTNRHANTTVPEAHGAARAYEVTGDARWRRIVEAYWDCAVTRRGTFATGGQTAGEIWTAPHAWAARLGPRTQEHCVVYNMIRLADFLYRWSGQPAYLDYIERNLYNGILAQQNRETGMVAYYLPLQAGGHKLWSTPRHDFWCCVGSLVQAHTRNDAYVYYQDAAGLTVAQYIPSTLEWTWQGAAVAVRQTRDPEAVVPRDMGDDPLPARPMRWAMELAVACDRPATFDLRLRLPEWLAGPARLWVDGRPEAVDGAVGGLVTLRRTWQNDTLRLELPYGLHTCPLPDEPETVAFMAGPVVLAGLCDEERTLYGDAAHPETLLAPDNEREWTHWLGGYRVRGQERGLRLVPLYEVTDEPYTVYFPVRPGR